MSHEIGEPFLDSLYHDPYCSETDVRGRDEARLTLTGLNRQTLNVQVQLQAEVLVALDGLVNHNKATGAYHSYPRLNPPCLACFLRLRSPLLTRSCDAQVSAVLWHIIPGFRLRFPSEFKVHLEQDRLR